MGVPAISTGDMLRKAVHDGSPTGCAVKAVMERGEVVLAGQGSSMVESDVRRYLTG